MFPHRDPLRYEYDVANDVLVVEGIRYAGVIFRHFARDLMPGTLFRFLNRDDGVVTIETMPR